MFRGGDDSPAEKQSSPSTRTSEVAGRSSTSTITGNSYRLLNNPPQTPSARLQHRSHADMSSNTRTINNFDHVVLDGMHDDKATKCWIRLLHHGVAFRIEASADNLEGTPLYQRWQALFQTEDTPGMAPGDRISRWDQLCDLLIESSLPVLQDLASKGLYDRSL